MRRRYEYVSSMGGIWRLSKAAYKRLVRDLLADVEVDLDDYGVMILANATPLEDMQNDPETYVE